MLNTCTYRSILIHFWRGFAYDVAASLIGMAFSSMDTGLKHEINFTLYFFAQLHVFIS